MKNVCRVAALGATLALNLSANAANGQFDSFNASSTSIKVGETVDFWASFSISTSSSSGGGSDPVEPAAMEGYQTWTVNWYQSMAETVTGVQLQAAGTSFSDFPSAPPGGGYSGSWSFSVLFSTPGTYNLDLSGSWSTLTESYMSVETASRNCYNIDPGATDALACDSWSYSYYDPVDWSTYDSPFSPLMLTIEVAAVPAPETYSLLLAGLVAVGLAARRGERTPKSR